VRLFGFEESDAPSKDTRGLVDGLHKLRFVYIYWNERPEHYSKILIDSMKRNKGRLLEWTFNKWVNKRDML